MEDGLTQQEAGRNHHVSSRSVLRWIAKERRDGRIGPNRQRRRIVGVMAQPFQDMLIILTEMYPQMYYRELAFHLEQTCGWAFTTEQVRQVLRRHHYKYNEIHEFVFMGRP